MSDLFFDSGNSPYGILGVGELSNQSATSSQFRMALTASLTPLSGGDSDATPDDQTAGAALSSEGAAAASHHTALLPQNTHVSQQVQLNSGDVPRNWEFELQEIKNKMAMSLEKYSGGLPSHMLLPDDRILNVLYARGQFDKIIAAYTAQINFVEQLTKGSAAVSAQGCVSSADREPPQPRGPASGPNPRIRTTKLRQALQPRRNEFIDENIPTREDYFAFLVNHVKQSSRKTTWCRNNLISAYEKAHPTHKGYTTWIGLQDAETGQYTFGASRTVEQILREAFPDMTEDEMRSQGYVRDPAPNAAKNRRSKRYTTAKVLTFIVGRMRQEQQLKPLETKHVTCRKIAGEVKANWSEVSNFPDVPQHILEAAWEQAASNQEVETVVATLKPMFNGKNKRPRSSAGGGSTCEPPAAAAARAAAGSGGGAGEPPAGVGSVGSDGCTHLECPPVKEILRARSRE